MDAWCIHSPSLPDFRLSDPFPAGTACRVTGSGMTNNFPSDSFFTDRTLGALGMRRVCRASWQHGRTFPSERENFEIRAMYSLYVLAVARQKSNVSATGRDMERILFSFLAILSSRHQRKIRRGRRLTPNPSISIGTGFLTLCISRLKFWLRLTNSRLLVCQFAEHLIGQPTVLKAVLTDAAQVSNGPPLGE